MKKIYSYSLFVLLFTLLVGCEKEDEYLYPPVKLEFLTAHSGSNGHLEYVITDKGIRYPVAEDRTNSKMVADSYVRILSNYELFSSNSVSQVRLYALATPVSVAPKHSSDPVFASGIKTDPAEVLSIWMGRDYLNVILALQAQNKKHLFHFVEEQVVDSPTTREVTLLLYHDAGGDLEAYTKRAYLSIPLIKYTTGLGVRKVVVKFKYFRRQADGQKVEDTRYCNPGFEYQPSAAIAE
ncbi:MAG: hypothetical protein EOM31_06215 [Bacteroidia bacterium]|nr:hypothetical protein [Bacteroidia bacterium]